MDWIKRFIRFHGKRHSKVMGAPEVDAFLPHLAVERSVLASTQNQAPWRAEGGYCQTGHHA
ncbi:MAG: phage integrase N-terminal SAM-like domain-containing protein [Gallionella sp.]